jgi:predicted trehalose synthase
VDAVKIVVGLYLASAGALLSSPALADDKETLVQDVKAFMQRCDGKTKETLSPPCANEWTELHRRQEALRLSNEDVNGQVKGGVKTRGGLHGGGVWFP